MLHSIDNNGHDHNKTTFQEIKAFIMKLSTQYHFRGKSIIYHTYTQEYISVYKWDWGGEERKKAQREGGRERENQSLR